MMLTRMNARFPSFFRDFDDLFRDLAPAEAKRAEAGATLMPATDVVESEKAIELKLDLPGVTPEGIEVKLEGDVLTVSAERKQEQKEEKDGWVRQERSWGRFARSFVLPETVEGTTPQAAYKHGVLTVTLPKKQVVPPKTVTVKVD